MSQETDWKKELRTIIREEVKAISTPSSAPPLPQTTQPPHSSSSSNHKIHESFDDLLNCKDCYPQIRDKVLHKEHEARKELEYECIGCGLNVKSDEEQCPSCGSTEARHK